MVSAAGEPQTSSDRDLVLFLGPSRASRCRLRGFRVSMALRFSMFGVRGFRVVQQCAVSGILM